MLSSLLKKLFLLGLLLAPLSLPVSAFAATRTCTCFCGTDDLGAHSAGDGYASTNECADDCRDVGEKYVGCYTSPEFYPVNNDQCWTEAECTTWTKEVDGKDIPGDWAGQNADCGKANITNEAMGYCYGPPIKANLNVPILGVSAVGGINEYIPLVYRFLIPAMSLVAVVMLMVGGLEYLVSAGSAKRVDKAKERMRNAVVGLVLLLGAYTVANFIDPNLVKFGQLRVPLVKQVVFLDPSSSCEQLLRYKFEISPSSGLCGKKGQVKSVDEADPAAQNSNIKVGTTCDWMGCEESGQSCMATGDGNECVSCSDVSTISATAGSTIAPSDYTCNQIATRATAADRKAVAPDGSIDRVYTCEFNSYGTNECVEVYSSGDDDFINCAAIRGDVTRNLANPCALYDNLFYASGTSAMSPAALFGLSGVVDMFRPFTETSEKICSQDVCGLIAQAKKDAAEKGETFDFDSCYLSKGWTYNSCVAKE